MRITAGLVNAQVTADLQRALAALYRQTQVSTGRRINAPADDPGGFATALTIRSRQAATDQFRTNIEGARRALHAADSSLASVRDTLDRAHELALLGSTDSVDALGRRSIAGEVDQLLEALVAHANARGSDGRFVFAGQESTTAPYTVTRDASGRITAVAPNARGIDGPTPREISDGLVVDATVSGTSLFGAATEATYAFDVLVRLRDRLLANDAVQTLGFTADVDLTGAALANAYDGIDTATALQIAGPLGTSHVRLTTPADDGVSALAPATSAVATAAAVNAATATTGVSAAVTAAQVTYTGGAFAANLTLDGTVGRTLVINGVGVTGSVSGADATARRDALIGLVNGQVAGVVASASGATGLVLTAADGRNISIATDGTAGAGSASTELLGLTTGLVVEQVVARGGVALSAARGFTTTENHPQPAITGTGPAASIEAAIDELAATADRALMPSTLVGIRLAWLDTVDERLQGDAIDQAKALSSIEDVDLVKAVQDLSSAQTAYQAALASAAQMLQTSLLNFLK